MTDRRATRQTARFPTNRDSEDQDTVSEDSNTGLSRNSSTETVIEVNQNSKMLTRLLLNLIAFKTSQRDTNLTKNSWKNV